MFSEALQILDRNTTKYMIDTMKQSIEDLTQENAEKDRIIAKLMLMTESSADIS